MFYDTFLHLCQEIGKKPTPAALEAGVGRSTVSYWKRNWQQGVEVLPNYETAQLLADYFGVPTALLLGGEAKKASCSAAGRSEIRKMLDARLDQADEDTLRAILKLLQP